MDITQAIREFLVPGQKNTNENLDRYPKEYLGLKVDLSFGLGIRYKTFFNTTKRLRMATVSGSFYSETTSQP